jgi:hypothetical protein
MQPLRVAADAHSRMKEFAQARFGQKVLARPVGNDAAFAHENDPLNLGQNVAEMMRHHHQAGALAGKPAQRFAQLALSSKIERVGGLVEQELLRPVNQRTGNQDAALLSGGHGSDKLLGKVRCLDSR